MYVPEVPRGTLWPARSALRPVPPYAVVPRIAVEDMEAHFSSGETDMRLSDALKDFSRDQPEVRRYFTAALKGVTDETALALCDVLRVGVLQAFTFAFGRKLRAATESVTTSVGLSLDWDEDLRRNDARELMETDDIVAIGQPHLMAYVRGQVEAALTPDEDGTPADIDLDAIALVYRLILVEVLTLGQSVTPPAGVGVTENLA